MSEDLLAKEKEFHRLNRELGKKTKDLMREVDSVLTSHSANFSSSIANENLDFHYHPPIFSNSNKNSKVEDKNKVSATQRCGDGTEKLENSTVDEILSNETEKLPNEAFVRFLKAKIKLLNDELQTSRAEYKKKCNYSKELETENNKLEEAKIKLHNNTISLKETIGKLEGNCSNFQTEIQARGVEITALKKEIESLKKEIKTANQQSNNLDVRLNRSLEENERHRNVVKFNKIEEKDLRDQIRRLQESERISINRLEKQRSEILQAFKKQTALVDNLKKQKAYLEASRHVQFTEDEFSRLLDWSPEKT